MEIHRKNNSINWGALGLAAVVTAGAVGSIALGNWADKQPVSKVGDAYIFYLDGVDMQFKSLKIGKVPPGMTNGQYSALVNSGATRVNRTKLVGSEVQAYTVSSDAELKDITPEMFSRVLNSYAKYYASTHWKEYANKQ
jgi:hypothetical protein